jgi:hypothetical protein
VRIFAARVGHVVRGCPRLLDPRNHLSPDRIIGIIAWDQIEKMRGDRQREFVAGEQNAAAFFLAKIEMFFELSEGRDPVFELPFPIVPDFGRNPAVAGPKARCVRDEFLPVPFFRFKSDHC